MSRARRRREEGSRDRGAPPRRGPWPATLLPWALILSLTGLLAVTPLVMRAVDRRPPPPAPPVPAEAEDDGRLVSLPPPVSPGAPVDDTYAGLAAEGQRLGRRVVGRFPEVSQATSLAALILAEAGNQRDAAAAWKAHLDRHPDTAEGWYRLGLYAVKEGRDGEAAELLSRAFRLDPSLPDIQGHLGRTLLRLDRTAEALRVLEPVVGDDRGGAVRLFHLGHALLADGRADDAEIAFRGAIERAPAYTGAWYGLATAAGRAGHEREAEEARAEFRRLKSRDAEAAAAGLGRDEAVRMRQLLVGWYASAGRIAALAGDLTEAEGLWRRGEAIQPGHPEIRRSLVELDRRRGLARPDGPTR